MKNVGADRRSRLILPLMQMSMCGQNRIVLLLLAEKYDNRRIK